MDKDALRGLADSLKAKIKSGVVVLASETDGKVQIVVAVTPDLTSRVKAGQIVKEIAPIVGGGGGGRPDFAEAAGNSPRRSTRCSRPARPFWRGCWPPASRTIRGHSASLSPSPQPFTSSTARRFLPIHPCGCSP